MISTTGKRGNQMATIYRDTESGDYISRGELVYQYHYQLTEEDRHGRTFEEYLRDCLSKNGFLEEVK